MALRSALFPRSSALKRLQALPVGRRDAGSGACVDLITLDPFVQRLGNAADLGCNRLMAAYSEGYSPRCSCTMRTSRSRTSGENLPQSSQRKEPPQKLEAVSSPNDQAQPTRICASIKRSAAAPCWAFVTSSPHKSCPANKARRRHLSCHV